MSENFSLRWTEFQVNASNSFRKLRNTEDFFDVTLVSDDQKQISAHKVVLSASSEYFKNVLRGNTHSHPMLCLNGVKSNDLNNMLDYIYNGELQIPHEELDQFMEAAERFQLEGLFPGAQEEDDSIEKPLKASTETVGHPDPDVISSRGESTSSKERIISLKGEITDDQPEVGGSGVAVNLVCEYPRDPIKIIDNIEELQQKVEEMMEIQPDGSFRCKTCGKIGKKVHMKEHVEIHIDGIILPCQFCGKSCRSRNGLRKHIKKCQLEIIRKCQLE